MKTLTRPARLYRNLRRRLTDCLFAGEARRREAHEREQWFGGGEPALDPAIPVRRVRGFRNEKIVDEVAALEPDLIVVFGTSILKGRILDLARLGIVNIHRDILPEYRGGGLPFWVFLQEDFENLGCTVHVCSAQLDGGDILGQKRLRLSPEDHVWTLCRRTTELARDILLELIPAFAEGRVEGRPQQPSRLWRSRDLTLSKQILARWKFRRHLRRLARQDR